MVLPFGTGAAIVSTISKYWYATHVIAVTIYASQHIYSWISPTVVVKTCEISQEIVKEVDDGWIGVELSVKKPSIIERVPRISLQFPTTTQIAERILTTLVLDAPVYAVKSLYQSPLLITLLIYYIKL